jgi:hypothetical protein
MAKKVLEQIETLEERLKTLKLKKQKIDARKRAVNSQRERREDTRRKILVGAIVLAKVDQGVLPRETLMAWLDAALLREDDRVLFGFLTDTNSGPADSRNSASVDSAS